MVVQEQTGDHRVPGMLALDVMAGDGWPRSSTSWLNSSRTAQAMASPLFGAQSTPQRSGTISASAPARTATTGMPLAIASSATRPKVLVTGVQQRVAARQQGDFAAVAEMVDHAGVARNPGRHVGTHQQQVIAVAEALDGVEQYRQVLFPRTAPGEHQQAGFLVQAEFLAQPRIAVARMEGDQVDAQRLYARRRRPGASAFPPLPGWGQDPVEVAVQLADVVVRVGAEPGAHAIAHQQRQVGW